MKIIPEKEIVALGDRKEALTRLRLDDFGGLVTNDIELAQAVEGDPLMEEVSLFSGGDDFLEMIASGPPREIAEKLKSS